MDLTFSPIYGYVPKLCVTVHCNIMSFIHRADINLLTRPNKMTWLWYRKIRDELVQHRTYLYLVSHNLHVCDYACELQHTK